MSDAGASEIELLRQVADLYGVQTSYVDMEGNDVAAAPDSLLAILHALEPAVESFADLADAVAARGYASWHWRLDSVAVAWEGSGAATLRLPSEDAGLRLDCSLAFETGETRQWGVNLVDVPLSATEALAGDDYVAKTIVLPRMPLGYHRLAIDVPGHHLEGAVIAAPKQVYRPPTERLRSWGLFLPLYAIPPRPGELVADFSDLQRFIRWGAQAGAGVIGSLPLLPLFLDRPFDPSPYSPVSRLFWNELYVNVDGAHPAPHLDPEDGLVPYREAMAAKRARIEAAARNLDSGQRQELERFLASKPMVGQYARFRAACERLDSHWRRWPDTQRSGRLRRDDYDAEVARYYEYAQWRAHEQVAATRSLARNEGVELYLDLPVGVHANGYDVWRYQNVFVEGASVGAPPDVVTTSGQNWGFAPLHPQRLRATGYEYVIEYLKHQLSAAGVLRIDHAMGLHRLYWVPQGARAREGVYVRYEAEEQYAVLCLESQRNQAAVVGENLGIVPDEVNAALIRHGIGRMYVMSIELTGDPAQPARPIPETVIASFGTHDLPPFAAFWHDSDIDERVRLGVLDSERAETEVSQRRVQKQALIAYLRAEGLLDQEEDAATVFKGVVALLARSPAERVMVSLEDTWLDTALQNVPGTTNRQYPNWSHLARYPLVELEGVPFLEEVLALLREKR